jgi:hypothetical protein
MYLIRRGWIDCRCTEHGRRGVEKYRNSNANQQSWAAKGAKGGSAIGESVTEYSSALWAMSETESALNAVFQKSAASRGC